MREHEGSTISRRTFAKGVVGLTAGLLLREQTPDVSAQTSADKSPEISPIIPVREFNDAMGDEPLTFDDAQKYNELLADLFVSSTNSPRSAKEIVDTSYIVQRIAPDQNADSADGATVILNDGKKFRSLLLKELCLTYPHLSFSTDLAEKLVTAAHPSGPGSIGGLTYGQEVFTFLDNINDPFHGAEILLAVSSQYQYSNVSRRTECHEAFPVTRYRTMKFHEDSHAGVIREISVNESTHIRGFKVIKSLNNGEIRPYVGLEELFADFNAAEVNNQHNLDFTTGYAFNPSDYTNMSELLQTINVTPQTLRNLHYYSGLQGFLSVLQNSPSIQELRPSTQKTVLDGLRAAFLNPPPDEGPNWDRIAHYFPRVDAKSYVYETRLPADLPDQGCIFPRFRTQE